MRITNTAENCVKLLRQLYPLDLVLNMIKLESMKATEPRVYECQSFCPMSMQIKLSYYLSTYCLGHFIQSLGMKSRVLDNVF